MRDPKAARERHGAAAEARVESLLRKQGVPVLGQVFVEHDGRLTEIDHLALIGSQIWIIETKGWAGSISGTAEAELWRQRNHGQTKEHGNPLWQNQRHGRALAANYPDASFRQAVIFTDAAFRDGKPAGVFGVTGFVGVMKAERRGVPAEATARAWGALIALYERQDRDEMRRRHGAQRGASPG